MTQAQELWAIKGPDDDLLLGTLETDEQEAWEVFLGSNGIYLDFLNERLRHEDSGFRAVRVRVEEIGPSSKT